MMDCVRRKNKKAVTSEDVGLFSGPEANFLFDIVTGRNISGHDEEKKMILASALQEQV